MLSQSSTQRTEPVSHRPHYNNIVRQAPQAVQAVQAVQAGRSSCPRPGRPGRLRLSRAVQAAVPSRPTELVRPSRPPQAALLYVSRLVCATELAALVHCPGWDRPEGPSSRLAVQAREQAVQAVHSAGFELPAVCAAQLAVLYVLPSCPAACAVCAACATVPGVPPVLLSVCASRNSILRSVHQLFVFANLLHRPNPNPDP
jgi:hypothetical protein